MRQPPRMPRFAGSYHIMLETKSLPLDTGAGDTLPPPLSMHGTVPSGLSQLILLQGRHLLPVDVMKQLHGPNSLCPQSNSNSSWRQSIHAEILQPLNMQRFPQSCVAESCLGYSIARNRRGRRRRGYERYILSRSRFCGPGDLPRGFARSVRDLNFNMVDTDSCSHDS